ncbi:UNVERIFIED_CONTAM: Transcription factor GLABRA 3 [Sesamum radiatum]|uniref:Transcription factor GLABRA 3 n=1 Tax=Sesamum radiatum TaxID=300843 RepID=A0AAW2MDC5_SESRA
MMKLALCLLHIHFGAVLYMVEHWELCFNKANPMNYTRWSVSPMKLISIYTFLLSCFPKCWCYTGENVIQLFIRAFEGFTFWIMVRRTVSVQLYSSRRPVVDIAEDATDELPNIKSPGGSSVVDINMTSAILFVVVASCFLILIYKLMSYWFIELLVVLFCIGRGFADLLSCLAIKVAEDLDLIQHIRTSFLESPSVTVPNITNHVSNNIVSNNGLNYKVPDCANMPEGGLDQFLDCPDMDNCSPNDCSNDFADNLLREGSNLVEVVDGEQSWPFMDDAISNCLNNSMNSSDCVSQTYEDPETPLPLSDGKKETTVVDKVSTLDHTIEYLRELERRVEELEPHKEAAELGLSTQSKPLDAIERMSDNYGPSKNGSTKKPSTNKRKASEMEKTGRENNRARSRDSSTDNITVTIADKDVLIEMRCSWRESVLLEVMEAVSKLHLDTQSVQSSIDDGILSMTIKTKL